MLKLMLMLCLSFALAACGPGEQGPAGPAGPPGAPGVGLTTLVGCEGFADLSGTGSGYALHHEAFVFADGSVLTTCEVAGTNDATSSMTMYASDMEGAVDAACFTSRDADGTWSGGWWEFAMNSAGTSTTAQYNDVGSPHNGKRFTFACTTY